MKIVPVVFELCAKVLYVRNNKYCCVAKEEAQEDTTLGARAHELDRYPFRNMRKSQEQDPF